MVLCNKKMMEKVFFKITDTSVYLDLLITRKHVQLTFENRFSKK